MRQGKYIRFRVKSTGEFLISSWSFKIHQMEHRWWRLDGSNLLCSQFWAQLYNFTLRFGRPGQPASEFTVILHDRRAEAQMAGNESARDVWNALKFCSNHKIKTSVYKKRQKWHHLQILREKTHLGLMKNLKRKEDILDGGYRWRKYGKKAVKGNTNRSYTSIGSFLLDFPASFPSSFPNFCFDYNSEKSVMPYGLWIYICNSTKQYFFRLFEARLFSNKLNNSTETTALSLMAAGGSNILLPTEYPKR
ncbi:hypothetical protein F8388_019669 [Cannabis sativa]|uniref:WRKY domain-containing protein n=1 Tax=Cannabis sativa TaxID=3483 RepID=A0A7J6E2S9_CANSA|nr:hypothetical protein F8388_019669 [Cannabis sativa]